MGDIRLSTPNIIRKKRDGHKLTRDEIDYIISGVVSGEHVEHSQLGALLMAIKLRGLTIEETILLTEAMLHSGRVLEWPPEWKGKVVDKHSTGGVGDKISLSLAPALAACGFKVPMISGRGLGHTGGTLDKLESIPGFRVMLSPTEILDTLKTVGCCIVGQTEDIDPADRIMYSIRDVTATIDSIPLITGSIVSKKAAENLSALVLDVKFGDAAFMKSEEEASELAQQMVDVSNGLGIKTAALLTSMDVPIGQAIGNALEVKESIECMQGKAQDDLLNLVAYEGAALLYETRHVETMEDGVEKIKEVLRNGEALEKFRQMIVAQGVEESVSKQLCEEGDVYRVLRKAKCTSDLTCRTTGYIQHIHALPIAECLCDLGAGRKKVSDPINHAVGLELFAHIGDKVGEGDVWGRLHYDEQSDQVLSRLCLFDQCMVIGKDKPQALKRIHRIIT